MKTKKQAGGNLPNNIKQYLSSLPQQDRQAAEQAIMEKQYMAYKNSPNQMNQQNMGQANIDTQLQELLMQYFQLKGIPEDQQQMILNNLANLSEEEKLTLLQELQTELSAMQNQQQSPQMRTGGKKKLYMKQ
jgi:ribosomal protein L29